MRRVLIVALPLLLACEAPDAADAALSQADTDAINGVFTAMSQAATGGQYRELGRFFTEDGVWMPAGQPAVVGRTAVQSWFTIAATDWRHQILEIEGQGGLAFVRASYSLTLAIPNFAPVSGKVLAVLRRQADGSWLVARYAFSCDSTC